VEKCASTSRIKKAKGNPEGRTEKGEGIEKDKRT
jgi:hypothetical protein